MTNGGSTSNRPRPIGRRTFLHTVYAATVGALIAACSGGEQDVFGNVAAESSAVSTDTAGSGAPALRVQVDPTAPQSDSMATDSSNDPSSSTTAESSTTTTQPPSTSETTSQMTSTTTSATSPGAGALPAGGTMAVSFTYEQQSGGKNVPPYIAVWIENDAGSLLRTVALWYQQFGRGERWLPDLARWYNVDRDRMAAGGSSNVDAISGPTRGPGSFQVAWDGAIDGATAQPGRYFVCVESARERGPYSLIREPIDLNGMTMQQGLSNDGELVNASVTVSA